MMEQISRLNGLWNINL